MRVQLSESRSSIAKRLNVPIRFIGVGEAIEDLREFNAGEFVDALLGQG